MSGSPSTYDIDKGKSAFDNQTEGVVMEKLTEGIIKGIPSIGWVNQFIKGNQSFAIVSACLKDATAEQNAPRTQALEEQLKRYSYYKLWGWWPGDETRDDITEDSYLVLDISKDEALKLGKADFIAQEHRVNSKNAQETIIYSDPNEETISLINPSNDSVVGTFSREDVDTLNTKDGYSQFVTEDGKIKGKKWSLHYLSDGETKPEEETPEAEPTEETPEESEPTENSDTVNLDEIPIDEVEAEGTEEVEKKEQRKAIRNKRLQERREIIRRRIQEINKRK